MSPAVRRVLLMLAAASLMGIAGWQAARISVEAEARASKTRLQGPPPKLRSAGRKAAAAPVDATADPVATYIARAKRGMTDREISWMLADFEAADLWEIHLSSPPEAWIPLLNRRDAWYLLALSEGLGLSKEQRVEAAQNLAKSSVGTIIAKGFSEKADPELDFGSQQALGFLPISAAGRISFGSSAPWNLCTLTDDQLALTTRDLVRPDPADPFAWTEDHRPTWGKMLTSDPVVRDPLSGKLVDSEPAPFITSVSPILLMKGINGIPLTPDQISFADHPADVLSQARRLQPAQLRLALLVEPLLGSELRAQLDRAAPAPSSGDGNPGNPNPPVATEIEPAPNSTR